MLYSLFHSPDIYCMVFHFSFFLFLSARLKKPFTVPTKNNFEANERVRSVDLAIHRRDLKWIYCSEFLCLCSFRMQNRMQLFILSKQSSVDCVVHDLHYFVQKVHTKGELRVELSSILVRSRKRYQDGSLLLLEN